MFVPSCGWSSWMCTIPCSYKQSCLICGSWHLCKDKDFRAIMLVGHYLMLAQDLFWAYLRGLKSGAQWYIMLLTSILQYNLLTVPCGSRACGNGHYKMYHPNHGTVSNIGTVLTERKVGVHQWNLMLWSWRVFFIENVICVARLPAWSVTDQSPRGSNSQKMLESCTVWKSVSFTRCCVQANDCCCTSGNLGHG